MDGEGGEATRFSSSSQPSPGNIMMGGVGGGRVGSSPNRNHNHNPSNTHSYSSNTMVGLGVGPNPPSISSSSAVPGVIQSSGMYLPAFNGSSSGVGPPPFGFNTVSRDNGGEQVKKKRGRPRRYTLDGDRDLNHNNGTVTLALNPHSSSVSSAHYSTNNNTASSDPSSKRHRGRPPGSGKKQQLDALGPKGEAFSPHVIAVKAGEDVASKIMAFSQQGPHAVCILSANGAISNVTLRQPATFGGTVTYEGRFEIISLSGSFLLTDSGGNRGRTGGMSVSLAGSDGRVLGGGVAGMLMAATPVQVVVGKFMVEEEKPKPEPAHREPSSALPPHMMSFGTSNATASSPSQGASSESSDENEDGSPINQIPAAFNSSNQPIQSMSGYPINWGPSHLSYSSRHDSDINNLHN